MVAPSLRILGGQAVQADRLLRAWQNDPDVDAWLVPVFGRFGIGAEIIPNLIDLERFRFLERDPLRPRLLSTRNFDGLYNVAATVRAFRLVQDRWPDATLTLVGGGAEGASLRALV